MTAPQRPLERQTDLDGLRGLAAFAVFAHHALLLVPALSNAALSGARVIDAGRWSWLVESPLHALWGGYEAVLVFFLLSGFVLFLATEQSSGGYLPFIAKRMVRLYPVYAVVVIAAFVVRSLVYRGPIPGSSTWLSGVWVGADSNALLRHLTLVGTFPVSAIDPVVWSLIHEARISLVFPLVAALARRVGPVRAIGLGLALVVVGSVAAKVLQSDLCLTIQYLGPFLIGASMGRHRLWLKRVVVSAGTAWQLLIVAISILFLTYYWWFPWRSGVAINVITRDIAALAGAAGLIAIATSGVGTRILSAPPIHWLGRVSYSFYLVHAVVLLAVIHARRDLGHWGTTVGAALALSFAAAQVTFVLIERPSMRWGRRLAQRLASGKPTVAPREA